MVGLIDPALTAFFQLLPDTFFAAALSAIFLGFLGLALLDQWT